MTAHISQAGAKRDPAIDEHEESTEMTPNNTDEQIRHVFDEWHRAVKDQDAEGMAALYAHDGCSRPRSCWPCGPSARTPSCAAETPSRSSSRKASRRAGLAAFFRTPGRACRLGRHSLDVWP
jgi:hypothetical protein